MTLTLNSQPSHNDHDSCLLLPLKVYLRTISVSNICFIASRRDTYPSSTAMQCRRVNCRFSLQHRNTFANRCDTSLSSHWHVLVSQKVFMRKLKYPFVEVYLPESRFCRQDQRALQFAVRFACYTKHLSTKQVPLLFHSTMQRGGRFTQSDGRERRTREGLEHKLLEGSHFTQKSLPSSV